MTLGIPTLRVALAEAARRGMTVQKVYRTGEVDVICGSKRVRINARRKDAPRALLTLLRRAARAE
jgi:hypothetical protein